MIPIQAVKAAAQPLPHDRMVSLVALIGTYAQFRQMNIDFLLTWPVLSALWPPRILLPT